MFWAIYFRDVNLLADTEAMRTYPAWHMHVTHTLVALTAVLDIALSRPTSLPYFGTVFLACAFLIKLLSGQRRKSKKEKARNRKPEPSASPKPKTSPQPTTGKKAKQKKQD
nr:unnamed protein product [Spirometra erinaceieuropaei]